MGITQSHIEDNEDHDNGPHTRIDRSSLRMKHIAPCTLDISKEHQNHDQKIKIQGVITQRNETEEFRHLATYGLIVN